MVDVELIRELDIYRSNDQGLYKQYLAWVVNFRRKIKKGTYETSRAVDGIRNNFVPQIAQKYRREVGNLPNIDMGSKQILALEIVKEFESENRDGNFEHLNNLSDIR